MSEAKDVRARLQELGERRQRLQQEQEAASRDLRELIRRALEQDVPKAEIARLAHVTPQAIWKILHTE